MTPDVKDGTTADPAAIEDDPQPTLLRPAGRVLSTLEEDGSRRWLKPRLSPGRYLNRRRWVAYGLILVFTLLPFIKIQGRPFILLDIVNREFTIAFMRFLPTDTILLALLLVSVLLGIVLFTALFGRVWCGWACPQTVYMEFVFRPIERLFDGTAGRGGPAKRPRKGWQLAARYATYFVICVYLSHTFLAYFVGVDRLTEWMWTSPPWEHPMAFGVVGLVTVAMMFDFCFFREQLCIIACPYGRLQSVLLDRHSLIVAYDENRGEPRGKLKKQGVDLPVLGDCIDCHKCVTTCPTGIDIRDGLQLECINCTQCMDACDSVMDKIGRPRGLIRYSSQAALEGTSNRLLRPRVVIYPLILIALVSTLVFLVATQKSFEATALRNRGLPFNVSDSGEVSNTFRMKITNRAEETQTFSVVGVEPEFVQFDWGGEPVTVPGEGTVQEPLRLWAPKDRFEAGRIPLRITLEASGGDQRVVTCTLVGP